MSALASVQPPTTFFFPCPTLQLRYLTRVTPQHRTKRKWTVNGYPEDLSRTLKTHIYLFA